MNLSKIPTDQLVAEIERREREKTKLRERRKRPLKELETIDVRLGEQTEVRAKSNGSKQAKRQRASNSVSLEHAVVECVEVRAQVTPSELAELLKSNGYQSTSPNFNIMVSNVLGKHPHFKRVKRGLYERIA